MEPRLLLVLVVAGKYDLVLFCFLSLQSPSSHWEQGDVTRFGWGLFFLFLFGLHSYMYLPIGCFQSTTMIYLHVHVFIYGLQHDSHHHTKSRIANINMQTGQVPWWWDVLLEHGMSLPAALSIATRPLDASEIMTLEQRWCLLGDGSIGYHPFTVEAKLAHLSLLAPPL